MPLSFKKSIPENIVDNPTVNNFVFMLDELYKYKKALINKSHRIYNPVLLTDTNYLRKIVNEQGYPEVPYNFPKVVLDNMYLCSEDVMSLMGSKVGLDYLLRVLTCGVPTIDDEYFYPRENYIILSDLLNGYLPNEEDITSGNIYYLFDGVNNFAGGFMNISIATPFYNFQPLKDYITQNIKRFIGFADEFNVISIEFVEGPFVSNPHMFNYFSKIL